MEHKSSLRNYVLTRLVLFTLARIAKCLVTRRSLALWKSGTTVMELRFSFIPSALKFKAVLLFYVLLTSSVSSLLLNRRKRNLEQARRSSHIRTP